METLLGGASLGSMEGFPKWVFSVEGFARITSPLTHLLRKNVKFEWITARERSFQKLKKNADYYMDADCS